MRYFLTALTFLFASISVNGQTAEDSVKNVVNTLFDAMRNADAQLLRSVFSDSAILQTIGRDRSGRTIVRDESVSEFAAFVGGLKKDSADERIVFETLRTDGPLAIVWTPYRFYHNGRFSHCGVNSFQLVRFNGVWKIHYLVDTRRREGCKP